MWSAFRAQSQATIIQSTFVLPSERAFGNYELKVADSVGSIFTEINYRLAVKAREAKNVLLNDVDFLAASVGRTQWLDARMWNMAKTPCRLEHLPLLAQSLLDTVFAASGMFAKCVVLDLDNTLWGGVIGDDGLEGIALGEFDEGEAFVAFQTFIRELKRRGIILAVVSKNEHAAAVLPFREHPHMVLKEEDISVFVANWDNKADNIRLIQKTLNIGFDSLVFLDDNPFERNIVREFLPEVVVPDLPEDPSLYLQTLAGLNLFETASFSEADLQRADQYREEAQRELTKTHFTNINDYLTSLGMEIRLERFNAFNLPRIAQLIQRSNQFNLMTRRYGEAACEAMMNDPVLRAPHGQARRQIRRLRPDFGRHSQARRRGSRNRRISDELPGSAARRRKLHHEQHLCLCRAAGREAGRRPLPSDQEERHGEGLLQELRLREDRGRRRRRFAMGARGRRLSAARDLHDAGRQRACETSAERGRVGRRAHIRESELSFFKRSWGPSGSFPSLAIFFVSRFAATGGLASARQVIEIIEAQNRVVSLREISGFAHGGISL